MEIHLKEKGKLRIKKNNVYIFEQDYIFNSPSAAAASLLGRAANGWTNWKNKNGKTLDEIKRR